ncbi:MAG: CDP-glucose 4,6-dehydratase [Lentisphaeria bacterium]|nr:CDP-glucose 4,6-dehydratase [Lentisphaeria bacterium]
MFNDIYRGKRVLVTGSTGFKGSWLCAWLQMLGSEVCGIALEPETSPAHYPLLNLKMRQEICDIRNREKMQEIFSSFQPEIVFHLAAQPLVRLSYRIPAETFEVNVMGTVNVLEVCRNTPQLRAIVAVTSDKCYENKEQLSGYRESDPMGGHDPYSSSKGCSELVINSYRRSFFSPSEYGKSHRVLLASGRAGNVIGGGDWAQDRLIPDMVKAAAAGVPAGIRNPHATRPWQHVLEPLSGYLLLGAELFQGNRAVAAPWNFGPDESGVTDVKTAVEMMQKKWHEITFFINEDPGAVHEAKLLQLNCTRAAELLAWHGVLRAEEMFEFTARWYRKFYRENKVVTFEQLEKYIALAEERGLKWSK